MSDAARLKAANWYLSRAAAFGGAIGVLWRANAAKVLSGKHDDSLPHIISGQAELDRELAEGDERLQALCRELTR